MPLIWFHTWWHEQQRKTPFQSEWRAIFLDQDLGMSSKRDKRHQVIKLIHTMNMSDFSILRDNLNPVSILHGSYSPTLLQTSEIMSALKYTKRQHDSMTRHILVYLAPQGPIEIKWRQPTLGTSSWTIKQAYLTDSFIALRALKMTPLRAKPWHHLTHWASCLKSEWLLIKILLIANIPVIPNPSIE